MKTTYQIFHGESMTNKGTFSLLVRADNPYWKFGKCVFSCTDIPNASMADKRATEYAASYGATIATPMLSIPAQPTN